MNTKKKFIYVLLAKGIRTKAFIANEWRNVHWDCLYPSEKKYVMATDEEDASRQIQEKIRSSGKWQGFSIIKDKEEKNENQRFEERRRNNPR